MNINALLAVLPPPSQPVEIPTAENILAVEKQVCILPDDYKTLITRYGTGVISSFIWILNPASKNPYLDLVRGGDAALSALRELRESGEHSPYPLFPEIGGLLPFGKTDNGDILFWLRNGEPDEWDVVVNAARDAEYERFNCGVTEFLEGLLTRRLRCSIFPKTFPPEAFSFEPTKNANSGS